MFAPVARLAPGDLTGTYAGAQGSASLGVGVGGNVLVGGSNNTIALQPLSVQGSVGINLAAGLESLELSPGVRRARHRECARIDPVNSRGCVASLAMTTGVAKPTMHRSDIFPLAKIREQAEH